MIARVAYRLHGRLQRTGLRNLRLAMPELNDEQRHAILKGVCDNISDLVVYQGFENYERAARQGRGVLLLTGHFGAWELCAFAQGVYGHPLSFLVRPLDNPLLNRMISHYRELSGNRTIDKNRAVKPVLETLRRGEDIGLLIDANTLRDQGVFCDFFGMPACSTTGLAVFALRADAPVIPGFLIWDEQLKKHCLRFEPEIPLIRTGDFKEEVRINTARYTKVIEEYARRHPQQWLWIHKRWHTRPEGEPDLYARVDTAPANNSSLKVEAEAR